MSSNDSSTNPIQTTATVEKEMSFIDHLEELRWHIIRALIGVIVITIIAFLSKGFIFDQLIFGPKHESFLTYKAFCKFSALLGVGELLCLKPSAFEIINLEMAGQFLMHIKVALALGFTAAFPYVFWEIWRFIEPGLYNTEVKYTRGVVFFSSLLFISGVLFGYFVLIPFSINFFITYQVSPTMVANAISLSSYISLITTISIASGIMFELPMVVYFLAKLGLVTAEDMRTYRRHAIIVILLVAAFITPADIWTQVLVSIPVYFLYEISIFIAKRVEKKELEETL